MNNYHICNKCKELGLEFKRRYKPDEFIEGKVNSNIWIIGLNPSAEPDWTDQERDPVALSNYFDNIDEIHSYFKDFKKVSSTLFEKFGKENGVAHTDLIKCSSKKWPPDSCKGKKSDTVIENCKEYLFNQIKKHEPEIIICNGAPVSHQIQKILKVKYWLSDTSYESREKIIVILSGFIGRIDDFSKRRLGYEIEAVMKNKNLTSGFSGQ